MFETLLKPDTYRVDYLAEPLSAQTTGLGFYLSGQWRRNERYCRGIKHALLAGLCLIKHTGRGDDLRAIYLDVHPSHATSWPAYAQLKDDLLRGFIGEVFMLDPYSLRRNPHLWQDWTLFMTQNPQIRWWFAHPEGSCPIVSLLLDEFPSQSV